MLQSNIIKQKNLRSGVSKEVLVLEGTLEQVSNSLHTSVGVIGKTSTGKDSEMIEPVKGS